VTRQYAQKDKLATVTTTEARQRGNLQPLIVILSKRSKHP